MNYQNPGICPFLQLWDIDFNDIKAVLLITIIGKFSREPCLALITLQIIQVYRNA